MELSYFSNELSRILDCPESVTRRQCMEFAARLYKFLQHRTDGTSQSKRIALWSDDKVLHVSELCPHAQFMQKLEQVLILGLDQMRRDLLNTSSNHDNTSPDVSHWHMLTELFLQPMTRICTFARVMRACMSPMRSWLDTSVLIGHRTLCLTDQIREYCLDHFLKYVAPHVSVEIFRTLHNGEQKWSSSDLKPVHQYVCILHQYQRFQTYLSKSGYLSCPYDNWEGDSSDGGGAEVFNISGVFVEPYLACLRQFYRPLLNPFDAQLVARSVSDWLMSEEILAVECDILGFRDSAINCLLQETVKNHLESFGRTVQNLMGQNDSEGLSLFFRVMVMVDGGLDHLLDVIRGFVKDQMLKMFDNIRNEFESLDPNSAKATSMYIDGCVEQMRLCRAMIDSTELHPSLNRNLLLGTVKTGIADVLNSNPLVDTIRHPASYPAAALALHFHRQMRTFRALDEDSREIISDLMTLYSLLEDKEAFMLRYHSLLRERLLSEGCDHLSQETEHFALDNFTQLSGWKAVYEVKSVLKDFKESEEFNNELRNLPDYRDIQRKLFNDIIPMKFTFVRGYFWRMAVETVKLPAELAPIVDSAITAYQSNRTGRVVSFAYSYGSGLLAYSPYRGQENNGGEVMLRCSTAVMILLLNFNEFDQLSSALLQEKTGIRPTDLAFYLHHLVRAGLLIGGGDSGDFAVNHEFRSSKLVNLMVSQQQHAQKQRRRLEKLDERMKEKRAQCAIVSVAKQLRQVKRSELFQLVQNRLPNSNLHASFFAEQLTYLISGGYIKATASEASEDDDQSIMEYIP